MALEDLDLSFDGSSYVLEAPTEDPLQRMRNRFRVQFLSCRKSDGRGCTFYSQLKRGRIKTNSDIVGLFSLSSAEIINYLRLLQYEIFPRRAALNNFEFDNTSTISLDFTLFSTEGQIVDNIEVTA